MTEEAKEARREYYKRWRAANPEKVREKNQRYWQKKADTMVKKEADADAQDKVNR